VKGRMTMTIQLFSAQAEDPILLPADGRSVELLALSIPSQFQGSQLKLDGHFQWNFLVNPIVAENVQQDPAYKVELIYQVLDGETETLMTPIYADTVSGLASVGSFQVEHTTAPNFTFVVDCLDCQDVVLRAAVREIQGDVQVQVVNARAMNGTVFC